MGYFDPLGLSKDGDVETFRRRRESELKNGRVAMFATIGILAEVSPRKAFSLSAPEKEHGMHQNASYHV